MRLVGLTVAMVEPKFGLNVGYVARTMKNFGVSHLLIVGTSQVPASAIRFASHGSEVVRGAESTSFEDLRQKFDLVIGTTAIATRGGRNVIRKSITPQQLARLGVRPEKTVLVLGRDTTGLNNDELDSCDMVVHISTGTEYPTLNISHALAIILFALQSSGGKEVYNTERYYVENALSYFHKMLLLSKYPRHRHQRAKKILRMVLIRSHIGKEEATTLLGVFRKVDLALEGRF